MHRYNLYIFKGVIVGRMVKKDTTVVYNEQIARSTRGILQSRDFLSCIEDEKERERIRNNFLVVLIAGSHASGKTKLADGLFANLSGNNYSVLPTRASYDADRILRDNKRRLLSRQKRGKPRWSDVVESIRMEAVSALENSVLKFMNEHKGDPQKGVIILNRYPFVDTLVKQYASEAPPQGVAEKLRGQSNEDRQILEIPGYLTPDLVFVLTCDPNEAVHRMVYRQKHIKLETSVELGSKFIEREHREVIAYRVLSGYDEETGSEKRSYMQAYPGETHLIDTSIPEADHANKPEEAYAQVKAMAEERARKILKGIIMPKLEVRMNHHNNKIGVR